jgi:hypothetical protein
VALATLDEETEARADVEDRRCRSHPVEHDLEESPIAARIPPVIVTEMP